MTSIEKALKKVQKERGTKVSDQVLSATIGTKEVRISKKI